MQHDFSWRAAFVNGEYGMPVDPAPRWNIGFDTGIGAGDKQFVTVRHRFDGVLRADDRQRA